MVYLPNYQNNNPLSIICRWNFFVNQKLGISTKYGVYMEHTGLSHSLYIEGADEAQPVGAAFSRP